MGLLSTCISFFVKRKQKINQSDKDIIGLSYLVEQEKVKCRNLKSKIEEDILNKDCAECFKTLRDIIQKGVSLTEWDSVKEMDEPSLMTAFMKKVQGKVWVFDESSMKKCGLCIERMMQIFGLKNEMLGSFNMESYFSVLSKLKSKKDQMGIMYVRISELTDRSEQLIDKIIQENPSEDVNVLVKMISKEVGALIDEKITFWKNNTQIADTCPRMDIDIGIKDIRSMVDRFKKLQLRLEGDTLREYIHAKTQAIH